MNIPLERESSSYRDPDGYVAYSGEDVYRYILNGNAPVLLPAYQAFFEQAVEKGFLVPFERADNDNIPQIAEEGIALRIQKLPLISYPYEWGFEQLKQAALVTLDLCLLALEHGLSLKDATAFNIQQYKGRMVFIDHTSFEISDKKLPWRPYSQFCRHFVVPLLLISRNGRNANKLFRIGLDGPDIAEACDALPFIDRFKPSIFLHVYLHNYLINNFKDGNDEVVKSRRNGDQRAYIQHLKRFIEKISPPKYATEWHDYYNNTNYKADSFQEKERLIRDIVSRKHHKCLWDLGANNGHFSRIMSDYADVVLSMDIDYAAIDLNFLKNGQTGKENIYPLVMDLTNPSPSLGLGNDERKILNDRTTPDTIVALALIHHLAITYNVPFSILARQFSQYNADLIIEYVDREDSQFLKLLRNKDDSYNSYNQENFEASFGRYFTIIEKHEITNAHRCLYYLKPRNGPEK